METTDKIGAHPLPLTGVDALDRNQPTKTREVAESPQTSRFKDLLEDIERLRVQGKKLGEDQAPAAKAGAQDLDQAMNLADRTHENAMDMRRSLEDAFRRHMKS
jgi:hypothetical protein